MWPHTLVPVVAHDRTTTARRDADLARLRRELGRDPRSLTAAWLQRLAQRLDGGRLTRPVGGAGAATDQRGIELAA